MITRDIQIFLELFLKLLKKILIAPILISKIAKILKV